MLEKQRVNITGLFPDQASQKSCFRFIHSPYLAQQEIDAYLSSECMASYKPSARVAVIDDTTTSNLHHLSGKLKVTDKHVGVLSDDRTLGQFYHVSLAISEDFGWSNILAVKPYTRVFGRERYNKNNPLPFMYREGYRWLEAARLAKHKFPPGQSIVKVSDREADSFEYFTGCQDIGVDVVVRAKHDRRLTCGKLLMDVARDFPHGFYREVEVTADKRPSGSAKLSVSWGEVEIKPPRKRVGGEPLGEPLKLRCVRAVEKCPPAGEPPLEWVLLTSLEVDTQGQALDVLSLYRQRWVIEELFKVLKSSCLNVEQTQLGNGMAIMRLTTIAIHMAMKIMFLKENRENEQEKAIDHFCEVEMEVLEASNVEMTGTAKAEINPYEPKTLAWAIWVIARLGYWNGLVKGQSPPGAKTLARGYERFNERVIWVKFQNKKVSTG